MIQHTLEGPGWLTGGEFGPEVSVFTIVIVLLALGAMRAWSRGVQPHLRTIDP